MLLVKTFFTIYRNLFSRLAHDESSISDISYPNFGDSTWPWVAPTKTDGEETARLFYSAWINFVTSKDFSWMDKYNMSDAPDRRYRRSDLPHRNFVMCVHFTSQTMGEREQEV
jgi:DnaJ family protein A protein 5